MSLSNASVEVLVEVEVLRGGWERWDCVRERGLRRESHWDGFWEDWVCLRFNVRSGIDDCRRVLEVDLGGGSK